MIPTSKPKLHVQPWCVVQQLPNQTPIIVARFRSESDADGYLQVLRRSHPTRPHSIVYSAVKTHAEPFLAESAV
jgi:hypothetical protein